MTNTLSNDNFQVKSCLNNFLNTCSYITSQVNCEKNPQKKKTTGVFLDPVLAIVIRSA